MRMLPSFCLCWVFLKVTGIRSSKAALHGLVHWLAGAYCKKGITVNGVAPALIEDTNMLPGGSEELRASTYLSDPVISVRC